MSDELKDITACDTSVQLVKIIIINYKRKLNYYKQEMAETQDIIEHLEGIIDRESNNIQE